MDITAPVSAAANGLVKDKNGYVIRPLVPRHHTFALDLQAAVGSVVLVTPYRSYEDQGRIACPARSRRKPST